MTFPIQTLLELKELTCPKLMLKLFGFYVDIYFILYIFVL